MPRGEEEPVKPVPLRFTSVNGTRQHIQANKALVIETIRTRRGARINVVYPDGKARTLSIVKREE